MFLFLPVRDKSPIQFRKGSLEIVVSEREVLALFLAALWFLSRGRAIGLGDAKLIFSSSLLLGFPNSIVAFLFSFWLGGFIGVSLLIAGRKKLKSRIPFGPFILIGSALAYFFGPIFLEYTNLSLLL